MIATIKRFTVLFGFVVSSGATAAAQPTWNTTLERISSGVVSIQVDSPRAFDTERNRSSQATGFVVDAGRGLILTNRHVVTPGPVRARAVFLNEEEVDLTPVYRDPVHDFGFFRYDPDELEFIRPAELPLAPDAARPGVSVRVVGNDAGEQASILAGTIARLDRAAPNYGRGDYNDFNTFYIQAASGTSGGSSGSPVIDINGRVVALSAGADRRSASSFFLPLDRVRVALAAIRDGRRIERGTLQTEFVHRPYPELRRLGLRAATEAAMREAFPDRSGLLVVEQVLPEGPAAGELEPGDVLVAVEGQRIADFVALALILDSHVGETVRVAVERRGRRLIQEIGVGNLHAITPDEYIEYGGGVFHELSYQQARHFNRPVEGVYVADPGYVFGSAAIPRASLITAIDGAPLHDLDDFEHAIRSLPEGGQAAVRFRTFDAPRTEKQRLVRRERDWFRSARCRRDDESGSWPCRRIDLPAERATPEPRSTTFPIEDEPHVRRIARSLVFVNFSMPYTVSGVAQHYHYGTGVVVDAERGWVVVDRDTVPVAMGDVRLTFAGSLEIPGRVEYIHPLHNLAIVAYDPALIGDTPVRSADWVAADLEVGQSVSVVGLAPDYEVRSQSTAVASVDAIDFGPSPTARFRDSNLEAVTLVNEPSDFDGVVTDGSGRMLALWASFPRRHGRELARVEMGIPADLVIEMVKRLAAGERLRSLEVEWRQMPLAEARELGLPAAEVRRYETLSPRRRELLAVSRTVAGSPAESFFRAGDILLGIDGEAVNTFRGVERASQRPVVSVTVLRDGIEVTERVATVPLRGRGLDRVVLWAGALLHEPHRALAVQRGIPRQGVYVSSFNRGSPASRWGLRPGRRIVAVDGGATPSVASFVEAVEDFGPRKSVLIDTVNFNGQPEVMTLELDERYWLSQQLWRVGDEWRRRPIG